MRVSNIHEIRIDGIPALQMDIDGKTAKLTILQKRTWLEKFGAVFLGADFEADHHVPIPADPADSRAATTLDGFTTDPQVVEPYREFLKKHGG